MSTRIRIAGCLALLALVVSLLTPTAALAAPLLPDLEGQPEVRNVGFFGQVQSFLVSIWDAVSPGLDPYGSKAAQTSTETLDLSSGDLQMPVDENASGAVPTAPGSGH